MIIYIEYDYIKNQPSDDNIIKEVINYLCKEGNRIQLYTYNKDISNEEMLEYYNNNIKDINGGIIQFGYFYISLKCLGYPTSFIKKNNSIKTNEEELDWSECLKYIQNKYKNE